MSSGIRWHDTARDGSSRDLSMFSVVNPYLSLTATDDTDSESLEYQLLLNSTNNMKLKITTTKQQQKPQIHNKQTNNSL